ncbi:reverse transcriptase domain-containing protein, partial [Tanacetum coccineum]
GDISGVLATYKMIGAVFYWKGLKSDVKKLVAECDICQRNKSDLAAYRGLIHPLPNPDKNREPLSEDILGATTQRDTGSYYPKRYWELLPKEILGAITQRDTGSYYPKRDWDVF